MRSFVALAFAVALLACSCTAQIPPTICSYAPDTDDIAPGNWAGLMWKSAPASTTFTVSCFQVWSNNSDASARTRSVVKCGSAYWNGGAFIELGQLPSAFLTAPMTFTCPVAGTFSIILYNEGSATVPIVFAALGQIGDAMGTRSMRGKRISRN